MSIYTRFRGQIPIYFGFERARIRKQQIVLHKSIVERFNRQRLQKRRMGFIQKNRYSTFEKR